MSYNEIVKQIDRVKTAIEKNFRECIGLEDEDFHVDVSQIFSPCDRRGNKCCAEDAAQMGQIVIRVDKTADTLPLHGLWRFLSLVEPPQPVVSDPDDNVFEVMMKDLDGSIYIYLDAERMFEKFG